MPGMKRRWILIGIVGLGTLVLSQAVFIAGLLHDGVFTSNGLFDRAKTRLGWKEAAEPEKDPESDHLVFLGDDVRRMHEQINRMFAESFSHFAQPGFPSNAYPPLPSRMPPDFSSESPMEHMRRLQDEVNRTFSAAFRDMQRMKPVLPFDGGWESLGISSSMNVEDRGGEFVVTVHLPSVDKSRIRVETQGRMLSVAVGPATNSASGGLPGGAPIINETFHSRLLLPDAVAEDGVQTEYADGRLTIRLPKKTEIADAPGAEKQD